MTNPWACTSRQVGMQPLNKLAEKMLGSHEAVRRESSSCSSSSSLYRFRSPLLRKLCAMDRVTTQERARATHSLVLGASPFTQQGLELLDESCDMYAHIQEVMRRLDDRDLLRGMCLYDKPVFHWEDMSHENKERLMAAIRGAARAILELMGSHSELFSAASAGSFSPLSLVQDSESERAKVSTKEILQRRLEALDLFNESRCFEDYVILDLFELLIEFARVLDVLGGDALVNARRNNGGYPRNPLERELERTRSFSSANGSARFCFPQRVSGEGVAFPPIDDGDHKDDDDGEGVPYDGSNGDIDDNEDTASTCYSSSVLDLLTDDSSIEDFS